MRFPRIQHVGRLLILAASTTVAAWACQGPEAFYRNELPGGSGGFQQPDGTGGGLMGTGGSLIGTGGMAMGTGGMMRGTGGMGTGGMMRGTGGMGTGGMMRGTGGMGTGGVMRGTGGMIVVDAGMDGMVDAGKGTGGMVDSGGTNPCAGLCTSPMVFATATFNSGNLPLTATCHETTATLGGIGLSNFSIAGQSVRSMKINNGTALTTDVQLGSPTMPIPAKRNGGYCFQTSAGTVDFSAFYTF